MGIWQMYVTNQIVANAATDVGRRVTALRTAIEEKHCVIFAAERKESKHRISTTKCTSRRVISKNARAQHQQESGQVPTVKPKSRAAQDLLSQIVIE